MALVEETEGLPSARLTEAMELVRLTKAIDGDILVLRCARGNVMTQQEWSDLKVVLGLNGLGHCLLIVLPEGIGVERLNDEAMMLAGWRRIEQGSA